VVYLKGGIGLEQFHPGGRSFRGRSKSNPWVESKVKLNVSRGPWGRQPIGLGFGQGGEGMEVHSHVLPIGGDVEAVLDLLPAGQVSTKNGRVKGDNLASAVMADLPCNEVACQGYPVWEVVLLGRVQVRHEARTEVKLDAVDFDLSFAADECCEDMQSAGLDDADAPLDSQLNFIVREQSQGDELPGVQRVL